MDKKLFMEFSNEFLNKVDNNSNNDVLTQD